MDNILVTGALGQLGRELTSRLRAIYGNEHVIATDIRESDKPDEVGPYEYLDVLDKEQLEEIVADYEITQIYHLAAILSAKAEQNIGQAWKLNVDGLLNVLELARETSLDRLFWPSSIAVFGPDAPKEATSQHAALNPTTVYGISKIAGEQWCAYYHRNFGVDVRSLRYPGLIGYKSQPGGGTTDYAVNIHHKAVRHETFHCFLDRGTYLPMMYMEDAINATLQLMQAEEDQLSIRTSYNVAAMSFSPEEIAEAIRTHLPDFTISYEPDNRQAIADSWPDSIDDTPAREDWGWEARFDLQRMVGDMLTHIAENMGTATDAG